MQKVCLCVHVYTIYMKYALHIHTFHICKFNQLLLKICLEKKENCRKFQKAKLEFTSTNNYIHSISIVFTTIYFIFLGSKITADGDWSHEIKRRLLLGRKAMTNLDSILKSRDVTLPTNVCIVKATVFFSSHVWMWELYGKEGWVPKNWCFWTVVLEKALESPLDCKEIKPVNPTGNQSWLFIGRTDAEAETPIFW